MSEKIDTRDVELLALKYKDVKLPDPKVDKELEELKEAAMTAEAAQDAHDHEEECCHHHDHEGHEHHHHHHEEGEECCGHDHEGHEHHHHHHHEDGEECCGHDHEGHEHHHHHHHEDGEECCGHDHEGHEHHHHHHDDDEECCCGHDHEDHEHHHHHHHHDDEPVEVSTHEDSIIATVRLGSLGRDKQAAMVKLRSFMRAVAEETEGLDGMIGHIKFFLKESKGTMFSMTDLEEIQEKPAEGFEYTAEGVCIVLGIEPDTLEDIVKRHLPEKD